MLEVNLDAGEYVVSTHGGLGWMSDSIEMSQTTKAGHGGILKRMLGGGGLLLTKYEAHKAPGMVTFASKAPGSIIPLTVDKEHVWMVHRDAWVCGTPDVQPSVGFQHSLRGSIFGGDGFVLEKLEGQGTAWVELAGETAVYDLSPGQSLRVHPGHVGVFQHTIKFEVQRLKGIANRHFGDDGFHVVRLQGPGRAYLMSLPLPLLAGALRPFLEPEDA
jgi:uncharacterized protein (TIGR00266 family)